MKISRAQLTQQLSSTPNWDMIIIGGGITGAGIFSAACQQGLSVLLLEQQDFAWGASSRSSKMVHGGLRYIAQGALGLTRHSLAERDAMIAQASGLVTPQSFVMSHYKKQFPGPKIFSALLSIYDSMSRQSKHKTMPISEYQWLVPNIKKDQLTHGSQFTDALTDDARLVQRLLQANINLENAQLAINYAQVTAVRPHAVNAEVDVMIDEQAFTLHTQLIVNATGAWSGQFNAHAKQNIRLRPLRGSHIIVPSWRLPVASAVSILHPDDKRPVIIWPWQNATVIGTTDVEHNAPLSKEACISTEELTYLLAAVNTQFPDNEITEKDIISTYAGVRPVIASGKSISASKEGREHQIWQQPGMIHIAGGKLTTFRQIAQEVMSIAATPLNFSPASLTHLFDHAPSLQHTSLSHTASTHLQARYGRFSPLVSEYLENEATIGSTPYYWCELPWICEHEYIRHLDDLMLRRTRLGNLLPNGGQHVLSDIKTHCQPSLPWNEQQWEQEISRYQDIWQSHYSLPQEATDSGRCS